MGKAPLHDGESVFLKWKHNFGSGDGDAHGETAGDIAPIDHFLADNNGGAEEHFCKCRCCGRCFCSTSYTTANLWRRRGSLNDFCASRRDAAHGDGEDLPGNDTRRKIDGKEAGVVVACTWRNRDIRETVRNFAMNGVGVGGRELMRGIEFFSESENVGSADLRPVDVRGGTDGSVAPVDHEFIRIVGEIAGRRAESGAAARVESLWDAVSGCGTRIVGKGDVEVALGELVGIVRIFRGAVGIDDGSVVESDLRDDAVV